MEPITYQPPSEEQLASDYGPPPAWQSWPAYKPEVKPKRSRLKTVLGGLALAGLLVVGGAATVFAADPTPAPFPAEADSIGAAIEALGRRRATTLMKS